MDVDHVIVISDAEDGEGGADPPLPTARQRVPLDDTPLPTGPQHVAASHDVATEAARAHASLAQRAPTATTSPPPLPPPPPPPPPVHHAQAASVHDAAPLQAGAAAQGHGAGPSSTTLLSQAFHAGETASASTLPPRRPTSAESESTAAAAAAATAAALAVRKIRREYDEVGDDDLRAAAQQPSPPPPPPPPPLQEMLSFDPPASQRLQTGFCYSAEMMLHATVTYGVGGDAQGGGGDGDDDTHPEQPRRISKIFDHLKSNGCIARMKRIPVREARKHEVTLVHEQDLWDMVLYSAFHSDEVLAMNLDKLEQDHSLYINQHSAYCARLSCGGVIEMCDAVASGRVRNGFAIVRPPGHHAEPGRSMGFCFFNNVAVAARWVQKHYGDHEDPAKRCRRILILDWDVHHGNGTQSAFWEDDEVLYISLHRFEDGDFFPGGPAGGLDQVGGGKGLGKNVNIPWPRASMGDGEYLSAFQKVVMPIAYEFAPDLIIVSAGFDAAEGDQLGNCLVTPVGYAHMTHMLAALADGRLVVALEGGYNLDAIARSALAVTTTLLGEAPPALTKAPVCDSAAWWTIERVVKYQSRFWSSLERPSLAPPADDDVDEEGEDQGEESGSARLHRLPLSDMVRVYRNAWLMDQYQLYPTPLLDDDVSADDDVVQMARRRCYANLDIFERQPPYRTLVVFAHDMGDLRAEPPQLSFSAREEGAYLVDATRLVLEWARRNACAVVDVNTGVVTSDASVPSSVRPRHAAAAHHAANGGGGGGGSGGGGHWTTAAARRHAELQQSILTVWDDYVELLTQGSQGIRDVVLLGQGRGCDAIMELVARRDVVGCVRGVVQVVAHDSIPAVPKEMAERRKWYASHSKVILPANHAYYTWGEQERATRRLGRLEASTEKRAIKCLISSFPDIARFLEQRLAPTSNAAAARVVDPSPTTTTTTTTATTTMTGVVGAEAAEAAMERDA